jgi:hypothetical protein
MSIVFYKISRVLRLTCVGFNLGRTMKEEQEKMLMK